VQAPKAVVVAHEYLNLFRIIPTDGRAQAADRSSWMGHPVGRWDGDTLVVDSVGYNDKTEINGYRHTESLHVVDDSGGRFRHVAIRSDDRGSERLRRTVGDPRTFPLLTENGLNEFVHCENNRD
jgi:hypothetical protein